MSLRYPKGATNLLQPFSVVGQLERGQLVPGTLSPIPYRPHSPKPHGVLSQLKRMVSSNRKDFAPTHNASRVCIIFS